MSGAAVVLWARWAAFTRAGQVVSYSPSAPGSAARLLWGAWRRLSVSCTGRRVAAPGSEYVFEIPVRLCETARRGYGGRCLYTACSRGAGTCDDRRRESGCPSSAWGWRFGHGAFPLAFVSPSACAGRVQTYLHIGSVQDSPRPVARSGRCKGRVRKWL